MPESDAQSVGYIPGGGAGKRCSECGVYSASLSVEHRRVSGLADELQQYTYSQGIR